MLVAQNTVNQTRVEICWEAIPGSEMQSRDMDRKAVTPFPTPFSPFESFTLMLLFFFQTAAVRLPALRMMGKAGLWFHIIIFIETETPENRLKQYFIINWEIYTWKLNLKREFKKMHSKIKTKPGVIPNLTLFYTK